MFSKKVAVRGIDWGKQPFEVPEWYIRQKTMHNMFKLSPPELREQDFVDWYIYRVPRKIYANFTGWLSLRGVDWRDTR